MLRTSAKIDSTATYATLNTEDTESKKRAVEAEILAAIIGIRSKYHLEIGFADRTEFNSALDTLETHVKAFFKDPTNATQLRKVQEAIVKLQSLCPTSDIIKLTFGVIGFTLGWLATFALCLKISVFIGGNIATCGIPALAITALFLTYLGLMMLGEYAGYKAGCEIGRMLITDGILDDDGSVLETSGKIGRAFSQFSLMAAPRVKAEHATAILAPEDQLNGKYLALQPAATSSAA